MVAMSGADASRWACKNMCSKIKNRMSKVRRRKSIPISCRLSLSRSGVSKARSLWSLPQTCSFIVLKPERAAVCGFLPSLNPFLMSSELREKTRNPPLNPAAASETKHKRMSLVLSTDAFGVLFPFLQVCKQRRAEQIFHRDCKCTDQMWAQKPAKIAAQVFKDRFFNGCNYKLDSIGRQHLK